LCHSAAVSGFLMSVTFCIAALGICTTYCNVSS
jgi:hypothetical protein